ncbi:MAG TPA: peptide-methionine (S)-S-oxide reductase MsrA [Burkholderiaceae bacterium]|nr:peptide-methionine (S)-S-oxide reductase MsrA [Burkholderiaceae bacterium]
MSLFHIGTEGTRTRGAVRALGPWLLAVLVAFLAWQGVARAFGGFGGSEAAVLLPAPTTDEPVASARTETAIFAGGCFWGVQGVFQHVRGVESAISGYAGGAASTAHYETVSGGDTGHAESVEVVFDPTKVSYGTLLRIFFSVVTDPTQLNRQGPDTGTQYRSALFPTDSSQRQVATAYIAQLTADHAFKRPIVTRIEKDTGFYPAEAYHQNFLVDHPRYPYIVINDLPKVANMKRLFPKQYRDDPVLVASSSR